MFKESVKLIISQVIYHITVKVLNFDRNNIVKIE